MTNGHAVLPFAPSEYQGRLVSELAAMAEHQADLLLVDQIDSIAYISGYAHSGAVGPCWSRAADLRRVRAPTA